MLIRINVYMPIVKGALIFFAKNRISSGMARKHFTTSIDEKLLREVKKLAVDLDKKTNDLIEEGLTYILDKYKKKKSK